MITTDKTSKQVIKYLFSKNLGSEYVCRFAKEFADLADSLHISLEDLRACVRWLESQGFVEYQRYGSGKTSGFHLSHKGLHLRYFRRREVLNYIADKWADFLAAVISLVSLAISIAALSQG